MSEADSFETAKYTVIISDLHLCEAEPINAKFPLWKKYKTAEFFFDQTFREFLTAIHKKAQGQSVELILNGDIFDFDSVTSLPESPHYRISWLEKIRGLRPRSEKTLFKIQIILKHHHVWVEALREFLLHGHKVVFVIGNHDLELHFADVQQCISEAISVNDDCRKRIRFAEWFYISNKDTLIEHGNQYDPYCVCEDPINPYVFRYNHKEVRLPFGNLATRYLINGLGFFNPHVDKNYIMSVKEYVMFFIRYMARAQPLLIWTWFWGSVVVLMQAFRDRLATPVRDPLRIEERVDDVAKKANATSRMVRELRELFVESASGKPILLARELWLDRAFLILLSFYLIFMLFLLIKQIYNISFFWAFIPLFLLLPFFMFYSKSVQSLVSSYKEPNEKILTTAALITKVSRIVYGHTHVARHEIIGAVEHLNSGCWSPAFLDVECTKSLDQKTLVWIEPEEDLSRRRAELLYFEKGAITSPDNASAKKGSLT